MRVGRIPDQEPRAERLDDILEPWADNPDPEQIRWYTNEQIRAAIRAAYRLGHDHGRMGKIRNDEKTFIEQLRERHAEAKEP